MPILSQNLSKMLGKQVMVTPHGDETLEQAEARTVQDHPDVFKSSATPQSSSNMGQDLVPQQSQSFPGVRNQAVQQLLDIQNPWSMEGRRKAGYLKDVLSSLPKDKEAKEPPSLGDKADVKKYINDLVAANEAKRVLNGIEIQKTNTDTGPIVSRIFDSSVPQYTQEGAIEAPGIIDALITNLAPEKTNQMRLLDSQIQKLSNYAFERGGKTLTGTEKTSIFNQAPSRFDPNEQFTNVLNQDRADLSSYVKNRVQTLKALGFNEDQVMKLVTEELKKQNSESIINNEISQPSQNSNQQSPLYKFVE